MTLSGSFCLSTFFRTQPLLELCDSPVHVAFKLSLVCRHFRLQLRDLRADRAELISQ
jgi:hypothetical protein